MNFIKSYFYLLLLFAFLSNAIASTTEEPLPPWMKPRELSSFQNLLQHSPFSLATAEDASPLSERYMLTGIITLDGEEQIFVMDRNDQSRDIVTKKPNTKGMALVNIIHDDDPNKLRATIRINGETGVINNIDLAENNGKAPHSGMPNGPYSRNGSHLPVTPRYPSGYPGAYPAGNSYPGAGRIPPSSQNSGNPATNYNNRRVIRRPPISALPGSENYQPGVPSGYPPSYSPPPSNYQPPNNNAPSARPAANYPQRNPVNSYDSSIPVY